MCRYRSNYGTSWRSICTAVSTSMYSTLLLQETSSCLFCKVSIEGLDPLSSTVAQQSHSDVTIGKCLVSDRNLACAVVIRHKTVSDKELKARGLTFTWWGCCGLCFWHKSVEPARSFSFCSCVYFSLYGPFNCISFHKFSRQLSAFLLCSFRLISTLLVLSTRYLFMKVSLSPDIIHCRWLA